MKLAEIRRLMKKILYLSYDGLTDPLGQSQVLPYLNGLSKKGFGITVISFEKKENAVSIPIIQKLVDADQINWLPLPYTKRPPIFSTLKDVYVLRKKVKALHNAISFDLIHCRSYITALVGLWMKRKKGIPFVFDMRGFWADERVDGKLWNLKNPIFKKIYAFFKRKEKQFLLESNQIVSLTEAGKKIILQQLVFPTEVPIAVIPCCVDTKHFDPTNPVLSHISRKALQISEDAFVLGYIGSIGTWYMLPEMLDYFKLLLKNKKEAVFLFVTREVPDLINNEAARLQIPRSKIRIVAADREEVPRYLSLFDWSIFFIKPTFSKQASSPTKQGELMSMGIPIICNQGIGDTDEIVSKYKSGVSISEFSEDSYLLAIHQVTSKNINKEHIRKGAIDFFSSKKGINSYAEIYESCFFER